MDCLHCESHEAKKDHVLCIHCVEILKEEVKHFNYTVLEHTVCIACKRHLIVGSEFTIKNGKSFCNAYCASRFSWRNVA